MAPTIRYGSAPLATASDLLTTIVDENAYVGEVYSLGYEDALVQIHDFHRKRVGGIPALSFLIATRVLPGRQADVREEDASLILLRVLDKCDLPDAARRHRTRQDCALPAPGLSVGSRWLRVPRRRSNSQPTACRLRRCRDQAPAERKRLRSAHRGSRAW